MSKVVVGVASSVGVSPKVVKVIGIIAITLGVVALLGSMISIDVQANIAS